MIVEIQIKLEEKQRELEELRQSLDTQHSAVDRLEVHASSSCSSGSSRPTRSGKSGLRYARP